MAAAFGHNSKTMNNSQVQSKKGGKNSLGQNVSLNCVSTFASSGYSCNRLLIVQAV